MQPLCCAVPCCCTDFCPMHVLHYARPASLSLSAPPERCLPSTNWLQGYLSYPRTETDQFDQNYDLRASGTSLVLQRCRAGNRAVMHPK